MAKGASSRSGPAPDPGALRRDRKDDSSSWIVLPATGRTGPAPDWPLSGQTNREEELWAREWRRPQAVMWERNGQEEEVAIFVRTFVAAEKRTASLNSRTLLRQQQEALGISLPGLQRNRWKIEGATASEPRLSRPPRSGSSAKSRFRVVDGPA